MLHAWEMAFALSGNSEHLAGVRRLDFFHRLAQFFAGELDFEKVAINSEQWAMFYWRLIDESVGPKDFLVLCKKAYQRIFSSATSTMELFDIYLSPAFEEDINFASKTINRLRTVRTWEAAVCLIGRHFRDHQSRGRNYYALRLCLAKLLFDRYWNLKDMNKGSVGILSDFFVTGEGAMPEVTQLIFCDGKVIEWFKSLPRDEVFRANNFTYLCTFLEDVFVVRSESDEKLRRFLQRRAVQYWPTSFKERNEYLRSLPQWLREYLLEYLWKNPQRSDDVVFFCSIFLTGRTMVKALKLLSQE